MKVLIVGMGQVGTALSQIVSSKHSLVTMDLEAETAKPVKFDVLHVCYPYSPQFVENTVKYIEKFSPTLTLIESTVKPGTTRTVWNKTKGEVCHSPVRGRHKELGWGLSVYTKFIGPCTVYAGEQAKKYYETLSLKTYVALGPEETEIAKLANLSYFAVQIAFFQELERKMNENYVNVEDVKEFFRTTERDSNGLVPRPVLSGGFIGGSCVMPGLRLLFEQSDLCRWIEESNKKCG